MPHSTADEVIRPDTDDMDEDIDIPDAPPPGHEIHEAQPPKDRKRDLTQTDVKLEDLFNDDEDEYDEFSSSTLEESGSQSSPPRAPPYVKVFKFK